MVFNRIFMLLLAISFVAQSAPAFAAETKTKSPTLWSFLGIPQAIHGFYDATANRSGNHPGLERKGMSPQVKRITDPANFESDIPAIKRAAEIKRQEDLAPQKIKAVKYLASIGCGCYDKDGQITAALLAALDDCTESVRLQTVRAIGAASACEICKFCSQGNCCKDEISSRLQEMAEKQDDQGCWQEPSERVRAAAQDALMYCTPARPPDPDGTRPTDPDSARLFPAPVHQSVFGSPQSATTSGVSVLMTDNTLSSHRFAIKSTSNQTRTTRDGECRGVLRLIDTKSQKVLVQLERPKLLAQGTKLAVYQKRQNGYTAAGELVVVDAKPGFASVQPTAGTDIRTLSRGDGVVVSSVPK